MAKRSSKKAPAKGKGARKSRAAKPVAKARRGWFGWLAKWTAVAAIWAFVLAGGVAAWFAVDLPDVDDSLAAFRRPTVTVLDRTGVELAASGDLFGGAVGLADLPPALPQAVIATEDRRFRDHMGVDPIGLARAAIANLRAGGVVQGGSTITQQVAKNLFLTPERTIKRKVQEAMLALWLERRFTKDQILTIYLNRIYFGAGAYGVEAASKRFFGRPASALGLYESAMLAGLVKAPSRYNPLNNARLADGRARQVLANMVAAGMLEPAAAQAAKADPRWRRDAVSDGHRRAPYFVDWVLDQVPDFAGGGDRDLTVVTTLDSRLQQTAEARLAALLAETGGESDIGQAALVAMTPDGAVRAMIGGADYGRSQFNRAVQARRQPGSAFKPFVFLAALESGMTADSVVEDAPIRIDDWAPGNFDGTYAGPVTLRRALAESMNTAAVRLAGRVGPQAVAAAARRLGIGGRLPGDLGIALGTGEATLIDLTGAYAVLSNGGAGVWPFAITEIRDGGGAVLYRRDGSGPGRVLPADRVGAMNGMMAAVVSDGTGRAAALDRPVGGKTGTSQDFRDAWFVGYTADYVAGVWMGNDDGTPMKRVTGGGAPARLWHEVMAAAHQGLPARPLPGRVAPSREPAPAPVPVPTEEPKGFWDRLMSSLGGG